MRAIDAAGLAHQIALALTDYTRQLQRNLATGNADPASIALIRSTMPSLEWAINETEQGELTVRETVEAEG